MVYIEHARRHPDRLTIDYETSEAMQIRLVWATFRSPFVRLVGETVENLSSEKKQQFLKYGFSRESMDFLNQIGTPSSSCIHPPNLQLSVLRQPISLYPTTLTTLGIELHSLLTQTADFVEKGYFIPGDHRAAIDKSVEGLRRLADIAPASKCSIDLRIVPSLDVVFSVSDTIQALLTPQPNS